MNRALHPSTAHFLMGLTAQVTDTLRWWTATHPDRALDPGVATGLCARRFPVDRAGRTVLGADERMWDAGRARYLAPRRQS